LVALDYNEDGDARKVLEKILINKNKVVRWLATKHMHLMLRYVKKVSRDSKKKVVADAKCRECYVHFLGWVYRTFVAGELDLFVQN
jgi:hypothetical protein